MSACTNESGPAQLEPGLAEVDAIKMRNINARNSLIGCKYLGTDFNLSTICAIQDKVLLNDDREGGISPFPSDLLPLRAFNRGTPTVGLLAR